MVVLGKFSVFGQKFWSYGKKWMYSGKMVVIGQIGGIRAKVVLL